MASDTCKADLLLPERWSVFSQVILLLNHKDLHHWVNEGWKPVSGDGFS